jgi:hypothetical protein
MPRTIRINFGKALLSGDNYKKLFATHTPGKCIIPARTDKNDEEFQMWLDAGEVKGSMKNIYIFK